MLIDQGHRRWIVATLALLLLATLLYAAYVRATPDGPTGGSWQGLCFGIAGSALMLFAGLLSMRKKLPSWRIGTARMWLKGHIWLGLLSVPLILFHSGFRVGGLLEQVLLAVLAVIVVSGVFGLLLQQYLPRVMRTELPSEAMYNQAEHVMQRLREAADAEVEAATAAAEKAADAADARQQVAKLRDFYLATVRPFLAAEPAAASPLRLESRAALLFAQVRGVLSDEYHSRLARLEAFCGERRQLAAQVRLRGWLHGWLLIHIPLSITLLVLGLVHAIVSIYY